MTEDWGLWPNDIIFSFTFLQYTERYDCTIFQHKLTGKTGDDSRPWRAKLRPNFFQLDRRKTILLLFSMVFMVVISTSTMVTWPSYDSPDRAYLHVIVFDLVYLNFVYVCVIVGSGRDTILQWNFQILNITQYRKGKDRKRMNLMIPQHKIEEAKIWLKEKRGSVDENLGIQEVYNKIV